jgi:hypothetical protein
MHGVHSRGQCAGFSVLWRVEVREGIQWRLLHALLQVRWWWGDWTNCPAGRAPPKPPATECLIEPVRFLFRALKSEEVGVWLGRRRRTSVHASLLQWRIAQCCSQLSVPSTPAAGRFTAPHAPRSDVPRFGGRGTMDPAAWMICWRGVTVMPTVPACR